MLLRPDRHLRATVRVFAQFRTRTRTCTRTMASASAPPAFKPFTLALIQLGQTGEDKTGTASS